MGQVVLDSNNIDSIIEDATGQPTAKVEAERAEAAKIMAEGQEKAKADDDVEDENGLTPDQKKDLTAKMQKAIGNKTAKLREAEEATATFYNEKIQAERRAEQLEREVERLKTLHVPATPPKEAEPPQRDKYESDQAYWEAVADHRADMRIAAMKAEEAKSREEARQAEVVEQARTRIRKAIELVPDYADVTDSVDTEVPLVVGGYMQESEMFAEIGYYLAQNPEHLEKIQRMTPAKQLVEIGKIESTLKPFSEISEKASVKKTAKEPSQETEKSPSSSIRGPITPINMGSAAQVEKDERTATPREAIEIYQKRNNPNLMKRARH